MKTRMSVWINLIVIVLILGTGCTNRQAATVGAAIGHGVGSVFGATAVAVEETIETTKDVQNANPRWDHQPRPRHRDVYHSPPTSVPESQPHYYSTNVVIKTRGPAEIVSVEAGETEDVTRFWGQ